MEKEKQHRNMVRQSGNTTKTILITAGVSALIIIAALTILKESKYNDAFNYANENATQLTEDRSQWSTIEWLEAIEVILDQSRATFYWQETSELSWKCVNKDGFDQGPTGEIVIRHNDCLLYLPAQMASIKASQSDLVLIKPQTDSQLEITQSVLRIAGKNNSYHYDIEAKNSDISNFKSNANAQLKLTIFAVESEVSEY